MTSSLLERLQITVRPKYRVERELRGASMSRVFRATDEQSGAPVVIKVLSTEFAAGMSAVRFKREIQVARKLDHPNIVPVLFAGQSAEMLYYVMPLVGESTLRTVMDEQGPMALADVVRYTTDVATALACAHSRNIVHRDIKPENILIDKGGGRALVTDFGIARAIERAAGADHVTTSGVTLGTPKYMSPEQASADARIDGRSDIYSLACVAFEMLAGDPPFHGSTARTVIAKHLNERPPSIRITRPDLPEDIDRVLAVGLAKSRADRFATVTEFAEGLAAAAAGNELPATVRRISARPRRRAVFMVVAVASTAAALAAAAVPVIRQRFAVPAPVLPDPSHIAVMQFSVPPGDSTLAALATGLARDLIAALQQVQPLTVISPEGVQGLGGARPDSIARQLQVGTMVTGSLERRGDSLEADFRLIDPITSAQRGSARVRSAAAQFLSMRDSVVQSVAAQLRERLGPQVRLREWRSQTSSNAAWELRQRAQQVIDYESSMRRDARDPTVQLRLFGAADSLLAGAASKDARWAEPLVARGELRVRLADFETGAQSLAQVDTGLRMAGEALVRRPNDPDALALRGKLRYLHVLYGGAGDSVATLLTAARTDLVAATAADPHLTDAWITLSAVLRLDGDTRGSVDAGRRALASDAYLRFVPSALSKLVYTYLYAGEADSARALCQSGTSRYPDDPVLNTCELGVLGYSGRGAADIRRVWRLVAENEQSGPWVLTAGISPIARFFAAAVLARSGLRDSANAVITATRHRIADSGSPDAYLGNEAYARMVLGEIDVAIALLTRQVEHHQTTRAFLAYTPQFVPMHADPRFRALIGAK